MTVPTMTAPGTAAPAVAGAGAAGTTSLSGIYLAEDIDALRQGIESGSWIEAGLGTVGASLDMLSLTLDPLGTLAAWGAAWLMENVRPLREALDSLAGDPAAVSGQAQTWRAVAATVNGGGQQVDGSVTRDLSTWTGMAADAYRQTASAHEAYLRATGSAAAAIGSAVEAAGLIVATVRTIVRNLIAEFVATLTGRLVTWAAEELFSAGFATPAVVAQVAAMVSQWWTKIATYLRKLVTSLRSLGSIVARLEQLLARVRAFTGAEDAGVHVSTAAGTAGRESAGALAHDAAGSLPEGVVRDAQGRLRGPDGQFVSDPNAAPRTHSRDTEYPGGYRQSTHDELASRWTEEGRAQGGPPVDANGERIPRDQLTWYDEQGRVVPPDQLTYDHNPPVVEHWNNDGYNTPRDARNDWYNNPDHLAPMSRSQNSSEGGAMTERYRQDTGPGYSR